MKRVMLFDSHSTQTYCVCSHNPTNEEELQQLNDQQRGGHPALTVNQHSRHTAEGLKSRILPCGCRAVDHPYDPGQRWKNKVWLGLLSKRSKHRR